MTLAFRILYAVHGKGTHHKLALDGIYGLAGPDGEAWFRVFLAGAARLVEGSKIPDDKFKDFTNHVLHPRDNFWGGAPQAATDWYAKTVTALSARDWGEAAWNAGVLSHYVTDPLMPFHTAQSEAENNIHRAAEWSINRAYDSLRAEGLASGPRAPITLSSRPTWLADLMRANATLANADYERLIAHYDIKRGVVDPPAGLDAVGRRIVSGLLVHAAATFTLVLDRAIAEAGIVPPQVSLALPSIVGALQFPKAMVLKKIADAQDRRAVEAIYDELMATGRVESNLPEECRTVREQYALEVQAGPVAAAPAPAEAVASGRPSRLTDLLAALDPEARPKPPVAAAAPSLSASIKAKLTPADDIEAAPSIGPKTAGRLIQIGMRTVSDLLDCDPAKTAAAIGTRHIDAATVKIWQQQARLVMDIPGLNGTQARLLTGAGYMSAHEVAGADAGALCGAILKFAGTMDGQRVLRDSSAPDADRIANWIEVARRSA